jgi:hypothetical protein
MISLVLAAAVAVAAPVPEDDQAEKELREGVGAARAKAIQYLKKQQDKEGSWEGVVLGQIAGLKGGTTALAALGLLEAGVPANDPTVTQAVAYLAKLPPDKTYVVSLHAQVLARVDAKKYAKEIQADADWLLKKAIRKRGKLQGWSYPADEIGDNSNTHFAVMGLHVAAQAGAKVDERIWRDIRDYFADTQLGANVLYGWPYVNVGSRHPSRSMTTAGLLCLAVATKYDEQAKGPDLAFKNAMGTLLGKNDFGDGKSVAYTLMTTAELGRALGSNEFKSGKLARAWYREGVEQLVKAQQEDGSFKLGERGIDKGQPVITTACGLYFLGPPAKK